MDQYSTNFHQAIEDARDTLLAWGQEVDTGHWQGVPTEGKPDLVTKELLDYSFSCPMIVPEGPLVPKSHEAMRLQLQLQIEPNLPWADDHFEERVSRVPSNPGEQYKNWPWWKGQSAEAMTESPESQAELIFSHTYQERFWPKQAGEWEFVDEEGASHSGLHPHHSGIRYPYGDLDDVVNLLLKEPMTRQAVFPIWFPEDTGAVHGGRVPCSLYYHFLLRNNKLHMWYDIRSCDFVRHFRDDIYLAARLLLWVLEELRKQVDAIVTGRVVASGSRLDWYNIQPGMFYFKADSLHYHKGDEHLVRQS